MSLNHRFILILSFCISAITLLLRKTADTSSEDYRGFLILSFFLWAFSLIVTILAFRKLKTLKKDKRAAYFPGMVMMLANLMFIFCAFMYHYSYQETQVGLFPGEAARIPLQELNRPFSQALSPGNAPSALIEDAEQVINNSDQKDNSWYIDKEFKLVELFASLEEDMISNRNIPLNQRQSLFYSNTAVILDALLKRFASIRAEKNLDVEAWVRTWRFYADFLRQRRPARRVDPAKAPLLNFDSLEFRMNQAATDIEAWSASVQFSGQKQVRVNTESKLHTSTSDVRILRYQNIALSETIPGKLILPGDKYKEKTVATILPSTGYSGEHGYIKSGYFDLHNSWVDIKENRFVSKPPSKNTEKIENATTKTMVSFLFFTHEFEVSLKIAFLFFWGALLFEFLLRLDRNIKPYEA